MEDYIYQLECNGMTISLYAWEEDPSKLAIHFLDEGVMDEEGEYIVDDTDLLVTFDREAGRQLADIITRFFDGNFAPSINGVNIIEYAKSLLKKPGQENV